MRREEGGKHSEMITMKEICWIVNREETLEVRDNRATLEITTIFLSDDVSLSAQICNLTYIKWNTIDKKPI